MFNLLAIVSAFMVGKDIVKEKNIPFIPAENWGNKELYRQDVLSGVNHEQRMNNLVEGKYKTIVHPKPHRLNGKIIIENSELYRQDVSNFGAVKAQMWVREGKYNLN